MTSDGQEHQEEQPDIRPALQQALYHAVEFVLRVGEAGEVAFVKDGRCEARLGKDHHAGRRLHQVGTGARAHHQEEGVLHFAVQPDDARQPAEDLALATLAQHRGVAAATVGVDGDDRAHVEAPCSRAARSFRMNCTALMT